MGKNPPASTSATAYAKTTCVYHTATKSAMAAKFSQYRVVASGIRIKSNLPPLSATGRILVGRLPMGKTIPGPNLMTDILVSYPDMLQFAANTGVSDGFVTESVLELAGFQEYTIGQLANGYVQCQNKPFSGRAFEFCDTRNTSNMNGIHIGEQIAYSQVTGLAIVNDSDIIDDTSTDGWSCIVVRAVGLPPTSVAALEIEFCVHIEGIPMVNPSTESSYIADSPKPRVVVGALNRALDVASKVPVVELVTGVAKASKGDLSGLAAILARAL